MSWITIIWSMSAGMCLTLGAVHFLVWTRRRDEWANLVFSITAVSAAGYAFFDMVALHAQTPVEHGESWRWVLSLGMLFGLLMVWFIRLHLRAGRLWLLWLICGLRALKLVLNFVPGPNFYFREVTELHKIPLLGELVSHPIGTLHPWVMLLPLSLLLSIFFILDATRTASRRDGNRRAWVLGGVAAGGFTVSLVTYTLYGQGILPSAFTSQLFLLIVLVMGYELSLNVLRSGQLSHDLLESQQRMRSAANAAKLSLFEWDIIQDEIWVTERGLERAGVQASERMDFARFLQLVHPDDREQIQQVVRHALEAGGDYAAEYRVISRDGATRCLVAHGQVERDAHGKPLRLQGVAVDVTERKKAEDELAQHRNELSHLSRVTTLSELSGSLAHELNQPLAIILTNAQAAQRLLDQQPPDIAEARDILADIVSEDERAGAVIKRLRAMLKPGQTLLQPLSANELVEDVLWIVRSDLIQRGIHVRTTLDSRVEKILGDRIQLQQVLLNLILNAGDAMAANPPPGRQLTISTLQDHGMVRISVSDTGCGLPPDHERIFEAFYTTKKDGLGLGLQICRSIVNAHHGKLWAESNDRAGLPSSTHSHGATFHVDLPAVAEARA